jgi:hypothetical protein
MSTLPLTAKTILLGARVSTYHKWLAPPDPSINHWIAHKALHDEDTFKWFLDGDAYKSWKTNGTLYWVRGKCAYLVVLPSPFVIHSMSFPSWLGQDLPYVCGVLTSSLFSNIY